MIPWLIWQIADSAFPTGGFAHSFGLEAAWHQGEVGRASLRGFVRDAIDQAARSGLPFVTHAHAHPDQIAMIDARCDAFLRGPVPNRASRVQGRAWLATIESAFPRPAVRAVCDHARARLTAKHHANVFGATLSALGLDLVDVQRLYLFGVCRGVAAAAVRLGIVGTVEAQRLVHESGGDLDHALEQGATLAIDDAAQTAPLIELWQSSHDRLYSRLFQS